jgi:L-galactose dehydrogenase
MLNGMQSTQTETMRYRRLGKTDLTVSVLGFGASPLGNAFGPTDPVEGEYAVHMAVDNGINFFDVSPYYGLTLAEERLGNALAGRRDKVVLATKCGRYGVDKFDFSARRIEYGIDESLERLQTDYVDLLQAHDVEFGDVNQIIEETLPAMRKLQKEGKTRYIGISGYPLKTLVRIIEAFPLDSVLTYCRYNLMITDMDDLLTPVVKKQGIGLINASGLHMGVLTERGAPAWHPAPPEVLEAGRTVTRFCKAQGTDVSNLALRFCLDHAYVSSTLVGMSTREHVASNLSLLGMTTDKELQQQVQRILAPVFNHVWSSGLPENRDE